MTEDSEPIAFPDLGIVSYLEEVIGHPFRESDLESYRSSILIHCYIPAEFAQGSGNKAELFELGKIRLMRYHMEEWLNRNGVAETFFSYFSYETEKIFDALFASAWGLQVGNELQQLDLNARAGADFHQKDLLLLVDFDFHLDIPAELIALLIEGAIAQAKKNCGLVVSVPEFWHWRLREFWSWMGFRPSLIDIEVLWRSGAENYLEQLRDRYEQITQQETG